MEQQRTGPGFLDKLKAWSTAFVFVAGLVLGFVSNSIRADVQLETESKAFAARLAALETAQKNYRPANELVTKEQFAEVVRRLDEKTDTMNKKLDVLLDRNMRGR